MAAGDRGEQGGDEVFQGRGCGAVEGGCVVDASLPRAPTGIRGGRRADRGGVEAGIGVRPLSE